MSAEVIDTEGLMRFHYFINVAVGFTVAMHRDQQERNPKLAPLPLPAVMQSRLEKYVHLVWCHLFLQ
jgi:hypothetical protein